MQGQFAKSVFENSFFLVAADARRLKYLRSEEDQSLLGVGCYEFRTDSRINPA